MPQLLTNQQSRLLGGRGSKWYAAGGAPLPVAVYQPKGAADLAASYVNLVAPGTNNAAPGVAPTFDTSTGWTFGGSAYLTTGITPTQSYSMIVRFSNVTTKDRYLAGSYKTTGTVIFGICANAGDTQISYWNGTGVRNVTPQLAAGVLAIAGNQAYRNGTADGAAITGAADTGLAMYIGALNQVGTAALLLVGKIQAVAIYSTALTGPQVAAISAALALI